MRVFLDTNVLVSAFGTRGLCTDVLLAVLRDHELVTGETVLEELPRVLARKFRLPGTTVERVVTLLRHESVMIARAMSIDVDVRDPNDVSILGEGLAGQAEVLVTGDEDLLEVSDPGAIRIVSPRAFWEMLRTKGA